VVPRRKSAEEIEETVDIKTRLQELEFQELAVQLNFFLM